MSLSGAFKNVIIAVLAIGIGFMYIRGKIVEGQLSGDIDAINSAILATDEVVETQEGLYERALESINSTRKMNKELGEANSDLLERNERLRRQNIQYTEIIAEFQEDSVSDTVEVYVSADSTFANLTKSWGKAALNSFMRDNKIHANTSLDYYQNGVRLDYKFSTETGELVLNVKRDPVNIEYAVSRDSSGNIVVDIGLPDYMSVGDINGRILLDKRHWYDKVILGAGLSTIPSATAYLGYDRWLVGRRWGAEDNAWMVARLFYLSDLWK